MSQVTRLRGAAGRRLRAIDSRFYFALFLVAIVLVALTMTFVSYRLYLASGAANLDLSRPGYKQALATINGDSGPDDFTFNADGPLDKPTLDDFKAHYNDNLDKIKASGTYSDEALSDENLGIFVTTTTPNQ